jgi:hypothetical protein
VLHLHLCKYHVRLARKRLMQARGSRQAGSEWRVRRGGAPQEIAVGRKSAGQDGKCEGGSIIAAPSNARARRGGCALWGGRRVYKKRGNYHAEVFTDKQAAVHAKNTEGDRHRAVLSRSARGSKGRRSAVAGWEDAGGPHRITHKGDATLVEQNDPKHGYWALCDLPARLLAEAATGGAGSGAGGNVGRRA